METLFLHLQNSNYKLCEVLNISKFLKIETFETQELIFFSSFKE